MKKFQPIKKKLTVASAGLESVDFGISGPLLATRLIIEHDSRLNVDGENIAFGLATKTPATGGVHDGGLISRGQNFVEISTNGGLTYYNREVQELFDYPIMGGQRAVGWFYNGSGAGCLVNLILAYKK